LDTQDAVPHVPFQRRPDAVMTTDARFSTMLHPPRTDLSLAMRPSRLPSGSDKSEKKPERSARHTTVHPACTATTADFGTNAM
jgi:hypothetical protein